MRIRSLTADLLSGKPNFMTNSLSQSPVVTDEIPKNFREALAKVGLSAEEVRELGRLEVAKPLFDLVATIALVAITPVLYLFFPHPLTFAVCIVLSLHSFSRFASLVHASDHGSLFPSATANRWFGNLCAYFMGYTRIGHRTTHQAHHSFLNTEGDADRIWGAPDEGIGRMVKSLLRDLFLVSAFQRILQYSQADRRNYESSPWRALRPAFILRGLRVQLPVIPVQLALLGYYAVVLGPEYYLYLYILPMLTVYPALIRLRSTVEHSFPVGYRPESAERAWVVRSTSANFLERLVVAPLDGQLHFEHHLLPGVPYYRLAKAHALITSRGMKVPVASGYVSFLLEKWREERTARAAAFSER
ncbi:MAG: fatty acid desaturase family protein [Steroidobacteraceae bacterium]